MSVCLRVYVPRSRARGALYQTLSIARRYRVSTSKGGVQGVGQPACGAVVMLPCASVALTLLACSAPARVGVQLQWGTNPLQPGLIANLSRGFDAARIDFLWTMVETRRGQYGLH